MSEPRNLARAFPDLFPDAGRTPEDEWPFWCGEGWRGILEELFSDIRTISREAGIPVRVNTVKEKIGALRVRVHPPLPRIEARIQEAVEASTHVCEGCGRPSERRSLGSWITTRCEACLSEMRRARSRLDEGT
jgi:hypothetical protein